MIMLLILIEPDEVERATEVIYFYRLVHEHLFSLGIQWSPNIYNIYSRMVKSVCPPDTYNLCVIIFHVC